MKQFYISQAIELMPYLLKCDFSEWNESEVKNIINMYNSNK